MRAVVKKRSPHRTRFVAVAMIIAVAVFVVGAKTACSPFGVSSSTVDEGGVISDGSPNPNDGLAADAGGGGDASDAGQLPIDFGLVLYLPFDEGTGTTAADVAMPGRVAELQQTAAWTNGKFGKALHLDGTASYATVDAKNLPLGEVTCAAWVNLVLPQGRDPRIVHRDPWEMKINYNKAQLSIVDNSYYAGDIELSADTWHHVAVTYDKNSEYGIYVDGVRAGLYEGDLDARAPLADDPNAKIYIGVHPALDPYSFAYGAIDEVRIYNRALSAAEIAKLAVLVP